MLSAGTMITLPRTVRVWAHRAPVDLRKGYNGLVGIVKQRLRRDVLDGDLFLFVNRRRTGCKVLVWDGTGLCIFMKRLERGRFAELWRDGERGGAADHERAGAVHRGLHARREEIAVAGADRAK